MENGLSMLRSKCSDRNEPIDASIETNRSKRTDRCFDRNEPIDASIEMPRSKQMLRLKCSDRSMETSLGFRATRAFGSARIRQTTTTTTTTTTTGERHGGRARGGVGSPGKVHAERGREPRGGRGGGARTRRRGERARGRSTAATTRGLARARRG